MNYKDLNLSIKEETNTVIVNDNLKLEIKKYLPIEDKIDLIQITLQKSLENNIYNEIKLDMYFNLHLVYMYSDLEFSEDDRADEFKLYDELESNEIIPHVIAGMEESEYEYLFKMMSSFVQEQKDYRNSAAAVLQSVIQDLPSNAAAAVEIMDKFDPKKYKEIETFVEAANAGRPISQ